MNEDGAAKGSKGGHEEWATGLLKGDWAEGTIRSGLDGAG